MKKTTLKVKRKLHKLIEQQEKRKQEFRKNIEVNPSAITITSVDEQLIQKCLESVSYTHLDVYKRQMYDRAYRYLLGMKHRPDDLPYPSGPTVTSKEPIKKSPTMRCV